jgi:transposase-like protein
MFLTTGEFLPQHHRQRQQTLQIITAADQLRKITKNRGRFPDKDAAMKLLYLGLRNISSHRGGESGTGAQGWNVALNTLTRLFPGRVPLY